MEVKKNFDRDLGENNGNRFVNSCLESSIEHNHLEKRK